MAQLRYSMLILLLAIINFFLENKKCNGIIDKVLILDVRVPCIPVARFIIIIIIIMIMIIIAIK